MIAALFVAKNGAYWNLPGVDPWDEARDARKYAGPWPVVAHPPCNVWCRLAHLNFARYGGEHNRPGNDGGCFAAALNSVRAFGGVLEHPAYSDAWPAFGLRSPGSSGEWLRDYGWSGGFVCHVEQGHYGHRARKATWLFAYGVPEGSLPGLRLGPSDAKAWCTPGASAKASRGKAHETMNKRERQATPPAFRDLLISIAESASARRVA